MSSWFPTSSALCGSVSPDPLPLAYSFYGVLAQSLHPSHLILLLTSTSYHSLALVLFRSTPLSNSDWCFPCSYANGQFWGRLPVICVHSGAHPILGCGTPSAPGPAAEPPAAAHPPASSRSQRPPSHLSEPGSVAHRPRWRGPPWGPTRGPGESGRSFPVQRHGDRSIQVQPRQLGSYDGTDPPQRPGCQVIPVSAVNLLICYPATFDCLKKPSVQWTS